MESVLAVEHHMGGQAYMLRVKGKVEYRSKRVYVLQAVDYGWHSEGD